MRVCWYVLEDSGALEVSVQAERRKGEACGSKIRIVGPLSWVLGVRNGTMGRTLSGGVERMIMLKVCGFLLMSCWGLVMGGEERGEKGTWARMEIPG